MNGGSCPREEAVGRAVRTGEWDEDLERHASGCPVCSEVALVAGWLREEADRARSEGELPDAGAIWLEAQLRGRREALDRALWPITLMRRVGLASGVAVASGVGVWLAPQLGRWAGWIRQPLPDIGSGVALANGLVLIVMSGGFLAMAAYAVISSLREA